MDCYLDTEFTSHESRLLISIGLVTDDGRSFYGEVADVDLSKSSDFVAAHVVPLLNKATSCRMSRQSLAQALAGWLTEVAPKHVVSDYEGDWDLMVDLLESGGSLCLEVLSSIKKKIIAPEVVRGHEFRSAIRTAYDSLPDKGRSRHHALTDARALSVVCKSMKRPTLRNLGAQSKPADRSSSRKRASA